MSDTLELRVHGDAVLPTLIYLPGIHGDWTLIASFREAVKNQVRFVEFTYPRTTTWTLDDYAKTVLDSLAAHNISSGWILGESFGSQVAWALLEQLQRKPSPDFQPRGVILAGGFARHPIMPVVDGVRWLHRVLPARSVHLFLTVYARYARFRHRKAPETLNGVAEFTRRRSDPEDRLAILHRYELIRSADFRGLVKKFIVPVYCMSGWIDPVVPWPMTLRWFRQNCPGLRESNVIGWADHNVLGTAPEAAAKCIIGWIKAGH